MKRIFSVLAFGSALAACQPQEMDTSFKREPAEAIIVVKYAAVLDAEGTVIKTPAENEVSLTFVPGNGVNVDQTGKITADQDGRIAGGDVTVNAVWNYKDVAGEDHHLEGSNVVHISPLILGGKQTYYTTIVFGAYSSIDDVYFKPVESIDGAVKTELECFTPNIDRHGFPHNGSKPETADSILWWCNNESEYVLYPDFKYDEINGGKSDIASVEVEEGFEDYESMLKVMCMVHDDYSKTPSVTSRQGISAFCRYTAYQTRTATPKLVEVFAIDRVTATKIGSFKYVDYHAGEPVVEDQAMFGYEDMYHYGHGKFDQSISHGTDAHNAGGGIFYGD